MAEPFVGEIKLFSYPFAPKGWALCNGQLLQIMQNQALFSILGTTYGGDGRATFALPDLRGRAPVHKGNSITLGQSGGEEQHTLTINEMPQHTHFPNATNQPGSTKIATGNVWGKATTNTYAQQSNSTMDVAALTNNGGSQPHTNMQPYTVLNYCIAISGIYPSRG